MSDSNEEDRIPDWLAERMIRNAHLYNKAGRLAEMAKVKCDGNHGGPPCADPECWSAPRNNPGLVGEIPPLRIVLLPDEAFYVSRLVSADVQRMTEARDHGVSHGMRGYAPPNLEVGLNVLHSLDMARTSATIDAIEALEEQRQDTAILTGDQDNKPLGSPA